MNFKPAKLFCFVAAVILIAQAVAAEPYFTDGVGALRAGSYAEASRDFRAAVAQAPASGALLNLGFAEWRQGRAGTAILAWEQAAWLNPLDSAARNNLLFARAAAQLEAPELTWYEIASTWLPADAWAWIASVSLWLTVAGVVMPRVLRMRKTGWHQSLAALGLGVFLLSLPPNLGAVTRSNLGIVLEKKAALRLTPTREGEIVTSLVAGESVRKLRDRGNYCFVRTPRATGWIERQQLGLMDQVSN